MGITYLKASMRLNAYYQPYVGREWEMLRTITSLALGIVTFVGEVMLMNLNAIPSKHARIALQIGCGAFISFCAYRAQANPPNRDFIFKSRYGAHRQTLKKLQKQPDQELLNGKLLKELLSLKTDVTTKRGILEEMNFFQLTQAREALGADQFRPFVVHLLGQPSMPMQLWKGIETLPSDQARLKEKIRELKGISDLPEFRFFMAVLDRELRLKKQHEGVKQDLYELAPFLKKEPLQIGDEQIEVSERIVRGGKDNAYPQMLQTPEGLQAFKRIANHCNGLPFEESLEEWLTDLKYAHTHFWDPTILSQVERAFFYLTFDPPNLSDFEQIVEVYQALNLSSPTLGRIKERLLTLYNAEGEKRIAEQYRYALKYDLPNLELIRDQLRRRAGLYDNVVTFFKIAWEALDEADFTTAFNTWNRQNSADENRDRPNIMIFKGLLDFFSSKDDPKARLVVTSLQQNFRRYSEAGRLRLYNPLEVPKLLTGEA